MKKLSFILLFFLTINNFAYADLKTLICENVVTKNKANIVYSKNFAKEEMSPNIWLFFQKVLLDNKNLKIVKLPNRKGDMIKVISNNSKLKKFIKWKPKFNNLNKIVKSSITWERKIN